MPTKVLIVEDESIIALDIKHSLQNAGYLVVGLATSAAEALEQTATLAPHLVLMDIRLDGEMDGVETAEQIRQRFHLPVIYLTAHADEITLQRAKQTEPFGYVLKPFKEQELIITIEITLSRHQAEEAMRLSLQKEKEFNELKSRFVAVVSHEFRNPLNTILFSSELLDQYNHHFSPEKKQVYLQRIQASVKHLNQLLNDVLTIEQMEAGKLEFCPQPLNLSQFCQTLIEELQFTSGSQPPIVFQEHWQIWRASNDDSDQAQALPLLDEKLLRYILINLLSNAIKYSIGSGKIRLNLIYGSHEIILQVQDEGIGIPAIDQTRLFNSFYRASNVQTVPGTGLGLSIVKQCVDLHGGHISFVSEVGLGTTFTVTLPLSGR